MRKDAKEKARQRVTLARVQGYHEGGFSRNVNYAHLGFGELRLYTSDRYIRLLENGERPDGKPVCGYGLEIEVGSRLPNSTVLAEVLTKVALAPLPDGIFKMQNDGSLDGISTAEIITQVITRERMRNLYPAWREVWDTYFRNLCIMPNCSCGMHTNISRACFGKTKETQDEAMHKLYWAVNRYGRLFAALLKRDTEHMGYCSPMAMPESHVALEWFSEGHGCAVNCAHWNEETGARLELRLVGPQKTFASFRNTMETVFALVDGVKNAPWRELEADENRALLALFKGCNQYVLDRIRTCGCDGISRDTIAALEEAHAHADYI